MRRQIYAAVMLVAVFAVLTGLVYPLAVWGIGQGALGRRANGTFIKDAHGNVVGSALIGQNFFDDKGNPLPQYFQPRPSAAGNGYDPTASSASNLGPGDPRLVGFVPGLNSVDLNGNPSATNPFATKDDPYCLPTDTEGNPVTSPSAGQQYAKNPDGTYQCDPKTVPERAIAYRQLNNLPAGFKVPVDAVTASASGLDPDISVANADLQAERVAETRGLPLARVTALIAQHTDNRPFGLLGERTVNVLDLNVALDALR
jgi:K+-transporting ATPase ATPase C chain